MRRAGSFLAVVAALLAAGCPSVPDAPELPGLPPVSVPKSRNADAPTRADIYADKSDESESKAAAAVAAAAKVNSTSPHDPTRKVVEAELGVASAFLSKPTETDRREAEARATKALAGSPNAEAYRRAVENGDRLQRERDSAWNAYEREKATAAAALDALRIAEAERRNFLLSAIGAGLFALGVVVFALGSLIPGGRKVGASLAAGGIVAVAVTLTVSSDWFVYIIAPPLLALGAAVSFAGWRFVLARFRKPTECQADERNPGE